MKSILVCALLFSLNFTKVSNDTVYPEVWYLKLIILNSDTIFYKGAPEFTYNYNYKVNREMMKNKEDSLLVYNTAKDKYNNTNSMKIMLQTDTVYYMTKMRSGRGIFPSETDTGVYSIKNDSIFMINRTRRNHMTVFKMDKANKKLYSRDSFPNYNVYMEFAKKAD